MDAQEIATAKAAALALLAPRTTKAMTPAEFISWGMDQVAKAEEAAAPVHAQILDHVANAIDVAKAEFSAAIAKGADLLANIPVTEAVDTASTTIDPAGGVPSVPAPPAQVQEVPVKKEAALEVEAPAGFARDFTSLIQSRRPKLPWE